MHILPTSDAQGIIADQRLTTPRLSPMKMHRKQFKNYSFWMYLSQVRCAFRSGRQRPRASITARPIIPSRVINPTTFGLFTIAW